MTKNNKEHTILIKPLSVNGAWQGRRFKTPAYKKYEKELQLLLPKLEVPNKPFKITCTFGFSNSSSDIDNPLKPFLDLIQKQYGINDRDVYELIVTKDVVKKGNDFIRFKIETLEQNIIKEAYEA